MTSMITSITPAQSKHLEEIRDEWVKIGLSTEPANRKAAEEGAALAYRTAGLTPPNTVIWEASPSAALKRASAISGDESPLRGAIYGQHDASFCAWLEAMAYIGVTGTEQYAGNIAVARAAGWWIAYDQFVILSDRPAELHRDALARLHNENGPAIRYRDGWGFFSWHGRRVPSWIVENPTPEKIAAEPNTENRRCAIESMGWDRFTEESGMHAVGKPVPDPGNPGASLSLYEVPESLWGSRIKLLLVTNGSSERDGTRRKYGLTVPSTMTTPLDAAAWTAGLTGEEYAGMARRT